MRILLLSLVLLVGCGAKTKRLSDAEKDHFYALNVWMDKKEEKAFLKPKTEEARNEYLKKKGFWDRFYQYDEPARNAIVAGEVRTGFKLDQVLMSWGMPHEKKRLTGRPATRSELYLYRFEVDKEGYITVWRPGSKTAHTAVDLYRMEVYIDDGVVTEMVKKPGWND